MKVSKINPALVRKSGLVGLGLVALFIGLVARLLRFGMASAYEALDRARERKIKQDAKDMSKRREWREDDDDDDRNDYRRQMEQARRRYELEIRASRDVQREQRKAVGRVKRAWTLAAVGAGLFLGVAVGNSMESFLGGVGFGLMVGGAINWFGTLIMNQSAKKSSTTSATPVPRRPEIEAPVVGENVLPQGRTELVQQVLGEAATSLRALDALMPKLRHPDSVSSVARIVAVGNRVMQAVAASPDKLAIAQRVFTYYCPESVKVADALSKLEMDARPDVERITSTQTVLKKLEVLFERTELELKADDGKELDIDLKLLDQSIEADLRTRV